MILVQMFSYILFFKRVSLKATSVTLCTLSYETQSDGGESNFVYFQNKENEIKHILRNGEWY
jgi:hypothetical protein